MEETTTSPCQERISTIFRDIGGFGWKEAEIWAGFCDAVGMDPIPFLKVMLENVCRVQGCAAGRGVPGACSGGTPELWVVLKGGQTRFQLLLP